MRDLTSGLLVPDDLLDGKKNEKNFMSGLIIPGDLPDDKIRGISQVI
jgi:hypothetical protein